MENNEMPKEENMNLTDRPDKQKDENAKGMKRVKIVVSCLAFILVLFFISSIVFSNTQKAPITGDAVADSGISAVKLKVSIPCPGHAQLIIQNLKSISGVNNVRFDFPNIFNVEYYSSKTSAEDILKLDVFNTYKAQIAGGR